MLSTGAFNALLKTLEEPPEHVKFILATTEPQKLPATILSRCQRFDFKRISNDNIIKRLKIVCKESNIEITEEALSTIAILSEGAMRDALSILERCIQDGENKIDEDKIKDLVGIPKITYINNIVESIVKYDINQALESTEVVLKEGKDITNLLFEMIKYVKDILVYKASNKLELYSQEELEKIKQISEAVSKERLINLVYQLSELENDIKWSTQKTILFQAGIIRLCNENADKTIDVSDRIDKIENYLRNNKNNISRQTNTIQQPAIRQVVSSTITQSNNSVQPKNQIKKNTNQNNIKKFSNKSEEYWPQIVSDLKQNGKIVLYTNLMNTKATELNDMTVGIEFPNGMTSFGKTVLEKPENIREISNLVSMACGKEMQIKYISTNNTVHQLSKEEDLQNLANQSDIPFNIIE